MVDKITIGCVCGATSAETHKMDCPVIAKVSTSYPDKCQQCTEKDKEIALLKDEVNHYEGEYGFANAEIKRLETIIEGKCKGGCKCKK